MTRDLLIVVGAFEEQGGLQLRWRRLARELAGDRRVTVLTWAPGWRWHTRSEDGYEVVTVPSVARWDRDRPAALEAVNTVASVLTGVVTGLVLRRRWNAALGAGLHPEGTVAGIAAGARRLPFFAEVWLVGDRGNVERLRRSTLRRPVTWLLARADRVLSATPRGIDELERLGIPADRTELESLHVDRTRFAPATAQSRRSGRALLGARTPHAIIYAGRFDLRQKRLDLLIDAWGRIEAPGWELILVGAGPDRPAIERLARGCRNEVRLRGWVDDVGVALQGADAFVLPTRFENPGYALLEAMACGLPGVASAIDVYEEMAPDGVTLAPNTVDAWTGALDDLVSAEDGARAALGDRCRAWIERSTAACIVGELSAVLDR